MLERLQGAVSSVETIATRIIIESSIQSPLLEKDQGNLQTINTKGSRMGLAAKLTFDMLKIK